MAKETKETVVEATPELTDEQKKDKECLDEINVILEKHDKVIGTEMVKVEVQGVPLYQARSTIMPKPEPKPEVVTTGSTDSEEVKQTDVPKWLRR